MRTAVRALSAVFAVAFALGLGGCGANRPEGPAERYLAAISRDSDADAIARFGSLDAAGDVLGFEIDGTARGDQKHISRYEIGPPVVDANAAVVPVQVWLDGSAEATHLALDMELSDGAWKVTGAEPLTGEVTFPSEGGSTYGPPVSQLVLICAITLAGAFVLCIVIVRLSGARPLHKRPDHMAQNAPAGPEATASE